MSWCHPAQLGAAGDSGAVEVGFCNGRCHLHPPEIPSSHQPLWLPEPHALLRGQHRDSTGTAVPVPPPLRFGLEEAEVVALQTLAEVGHAAELLVVIVELVLGVLALDPLCGDSGGSRTTASGPWRQRSSSLTPAARLCPALSPGRAVSLRLRCGPARVPHPGVAVLALLPCPTVPVTVS